MLYLEKSLLTNPFLMFNKKKMQLFTLCQFHSFQIGVSWNIGDAGHLFFELKTKLGPYHVVPTKPKKTARSITLSFVEMQHLTDSEKIHLKGRIIFRKKDSIEP